MDFTYDARTEELRAELLDFMDSHVYPAEPVFAEQMAALEDHWAWTTVPVLHELRAEARRRGLWNLFLPAEHGDLGAGLTNLQYAPLAEITGRSGHLAPAALNCAAPDTGNMEVLSMFGTEEQKERWLKPLLDGRIRSSFAMTEPDVASSDATNIATRIERDGDEYVVNGRKWWITGAMNPECRDLHRDGQDRPGGLAAPAAEPAARPPRHPRRDDRARHAGARVRRPRPRRPRRDPLRGRAGARRQPDRRGGQGLRDRPGPPRPRPDPPLHARRSAWPSGPSS